LVPPSTHLADTLMPSASVHEAGSPSRSSRPASTRGEAGSRARCALPLWPATIDACVPLAAQLEGSAELGGPPGHAPRRPSRLRPSQARRTTTSAGRSAREPSTSPA